MTARLSSAVSSWSPVRAASAGVVLAAACLVIGFGLARLTSPGVAEAGRAVPSADIGDAAVLEGDPATSDVRFHPAAPTDHLVVVEVSVSVCGGRSVGTGVSNAEP